MHGVPSPSALPRLGALVLDMRGVEGGTGRIHGFEVPVSTVEDEIYCVVCLEQEHQLVRLQRWEEEGEGAYARLRLAAA